MVSVRKAVAADVPAILELVKSLAAYEHEAHSVVATEEDLLRDGFGPTPAFHVLMATLADEPIGFALYFFTYSTWLGRKCLYLEDLFVEPEHRRRGAGVAMMRALAGEAVRENCGRFDLQVLDWNEPTLGFYQKLGAKVRRDWLAVRLESEALAALARP
jgi:GNAT superfamily N-acetyltransferase